eukprot:531925_1
MLRLLIPIPYDIFHSSYPTLLRNNLHRVHLALVLRYESLLIVFFEHLSYLIVLITQPYKSRGTNIPSNSFTIECVPCAINALECQDTIRGFFRAIHELFSSSIYSLYCLQNVLCGLRILGHQSTSIHSICDIII